MTPEEKAEELYTKIDDLLAIDLTLDITITDEEITDYVKKNCIICIDEIIDATEGIGGNYWQNVKDEIKKK